MTRFAADVVPEAPHPEYPRPQMVREKWTNLNGLWEYAIASSGGGAPEGYDGSILVPFPIESALSGVMERVSPEQTLWYRRTIAAADLEAAGSGARTLLHFGAVDWHARVHVNGQLVGEHKGGYDPFSFDVTDALRDGDNELVVEVTDPTDTASQPHGKQFVKPGGIWYTPVTGIWQTVWLERVPEAHLASLMAVPNVDEKSLTVKVKGFGLDGTTLRVTAVGATAEVDGSDEASVTIDVGDAELWSPKSPALHDLKIEVVRDGQAVDSIESYFAMRKVEVKPDDEGMNRMYLNGEEIFSFGLLDQGWWPDGLYTAPTDEALKSDLELTKQWGFNTVRKHVKVEPARFYRHCDEMGLLVWQDMPSVRHPSPDWDRRVDVDGPDAEFPPEAAEQFRAELMELVEDFGHFPSIVMWVPFNERWGQHDTVATVEYMKQLDPTRLINSASGGNFKGVGDVLDIHSYPNPAFPGVDENQIAACGEFGGLGWPVEGHLWQPDQNWGYRTYQSREELVKNYAEKLDMLPILRARGLAAAIYTQTTDVEIEVNGLITYDREVVKISPEVAKPLNDAIYATSPKVEYLVNTSRSGESTWSYTAEEPTGDWQSADFDASAWETGPGGFGRNVQGNFAANGIETEVDEEDLWLRHAFEIDDISGDFWVDVAHTGRMNVFLNGEQIFEANGQVYDYGLYKLSDVARDALREGTNVLSIRYHRNREDRQFADAGLLRATAAD